MRWTPGAIAYWPWSKQCPPLSSYVSLESIKRGQRNQTHRNVTRIKSENSYNTCGPSWASTVSCHTTDTASGIGRQEEKGPSVSPEQPLVQWEKKNSQLTFEGALSTAPGHKQGAQQTWVLYPPSLKLKNSLNKKTHLLPNISKPFSFPTHSSAAYLLPECSAQGRQWPSNQAVLPLTWPLLSAHSCACVFQNPLSSVASVELSYIFHLLFWLFGWLLFHSLNVGAPKNPAPLSSPHTCSQRQTHEPHSPLIPHAENTHLHTGPKSPSSSPDPHFLSAHEQLHLAVWNTSPTEHAYY